MPFEINILSDVGSKVENLFGYRRALIERANEDI